jgi:hypothetical protein
MTGSLVCSGIAAGLMPPESTHFWILLANPSQADILVD